MYNSNYPLAFSKLQLSMLLMFSKIQILTEFYTLAISFAGVLRGERRWRGRGALGVTEDEYRSEEAGYLLRDLGASIMSSRC